MSSLDLRYSKDGGYTWSDWRKLPMGDVGAHLKRIQTRGFGMGYQWVFDIRVTDPVPSDLLAASWMPEQVDS